MSQAGGKFTCYGNKNNSTSGAFGYSVPCLNSSYYDVATKSTVSPTWTADAASGPTAFGGAGTPAAKGRSDVG